MEVHCFVPGDRAHVFVCEVILRTSRRLVLGGTAKYDIKMEIIPLCDSIPLDHDLCPPRVKVITVTRNLSGEEVAMEFIGYLYDLSVLSNVDKMIIYEERGTRKKAVK